MWGKLVTCLQRNNVGQVGNLPVKNGQDTILSYITAHTPFEHRSDIFNSALSASLR